MMQMAAAMMALFCLAGSIRQRRWAAAMMASPQEAVHVYHELSPKALRCLHRMPLWVAWRLFPASPIRQRRWAAATMVSLQETVQV